jgi:hypothetical protein
MRQTHHTPGADDVEGATKRAERETKGNGKGAGPGGGNGTKSKLQFQLIKVKDIHYDPMDDHWLVDGLLPVTGLAAIWGKYKSYKSFIALDIAVAIADRRQETWGDRALLHGSVVYVVAEDMHGFDARIEAYRRERPGFDDLPLYIIKARPNFGAVASDREALIEAINEELGDGAPVAIFLDTLARMLNGEGENDSGMQNFVNNAEYVAEAFQCLAVAVHHESAATEANPAADKPRGHTSLPGALVASLHVIKTSDGIAGPWTADVIVIGAKNSATGFALKAGMKRIDLGENRRGRMETILMLDTIEWPTSETAAPKATRKAPEALTQFMNCFRYVRDGAGGTERRQVRGHNGPWVDAVDSARVREVFFQRYANRTRLNDEDDDKARKRASDAKAKAFDRAVASAVKTERLFTEASADGRVFLWFA